MLSGSTTARYLRSEPLAVTSLVILFFFFLLTALGPFVAPYDPASLSGARMQPPSAGHLFGTDFFGRDVLSRVLHGARPTFAAGVAATALSFVVGFPLGVLSGYKGGRIDFSLMRVIDTLISFPDLILAIALAAALGPSLQNAVVAVSVGFTPAIARLARSQALIVANSGFVVAAKGFGTNDSRILLRHVMPNTVGIVLVQSSLFVGRAILSIAGLGFLGLGEPPPIPEWGADIARGMPYIREAAWITMFPGLFVVMAVLGLALLGESVADLFNPRLSR